ncbi:MAG: hypothetical protein HY791_00445 [Deltaproteobacteria bacterium]|nr:hypothetical protein [Deltaproteobacteria bacterium]
MRTTSPQRTQIQARLHPDESSKKDRVGAQYRSTTLSPALERAPRPGPTLRRLELRVRFLDDERTLPVVELKQAA